MNRCLLLALLVPLGAAAPPPRGLTLEVPRYNGPALPVPAPAPAPPPTAFQPAPLPNRDLDAPAGPRPDNTPSVAPSLFNRSDTYRGEGYSRGSTAQTEQERRVKPGAGFNLRLPFAPQ